MSGKSAEQQARDLLEQCGVEDAQSFTAGDVVALANYVAEKERLRRIPLAFTDDLGRRWEWCGGQPGTWAWRITAMSDERQ